MSKHEIAHTTNFSSLLQLGKSLGALYLNDLKVGCNAQYTSERFIQEAATILASVVSGWIFEQLKASFFTLMVDETTNIAVVKEVIIYACYLDQKRKVQTSFIAIRSCGWSYRHHKGGLRKLCSNHQLNMDKLVAFGSDGAAVMMGNQNSVAAQV